MDYGRTNPPTDTPEFFTSGAGTNDENVNNFEANNNLNLNNTEAGWGQPMAPERDEQSIGNKTRISTELQMPPSEMPTPPRYGEVIDLSPESAPIPKPFPDQPDQSNQRNINQIQELTDTELSPNSNFELIKTTDRLSEEGVKMIEEEKQEFIQTGNTEKFYHNVRAKMLPEHMKQSYGANSNWGREAA